jgi:hypothetical protein
MSYKDALADGIRYEKQGKGSSAYFPPCHICGEETFSLNYIPSRKYTCERCKKRRASYSSHRKGMARMPKL